MIYLDNSSTTKPYPELLQIYEQVNQRFFGNPSSLHRHGIEADQLLSEARKQIKTALSLKVMISCLRPGLQKPTTWR